MNALASGTTEALVGVTLSAPYALPVTMDYATADGTAKAGIDYVAVSATPIVFAPGQTSQSAPVILEPEPAGSPAKSFSIALSNPQNATIIDAPGTAVILAPGSFPPSLPTPTPVINPETEPQVSINPTSVVPSDDTMTEAVFSVALSAEYNRTVVVYYGTLDGSATAGTNAVNTHTDSPCFRAAVERNHPGQPIA